MSLPQCIEGCPQPESTHKTQVRHKQRHRSRTVSKTSLRGVEAGSRRMRVQEILGKDVHNTAPDIAASENAVQTK